ncbi:hypothetical protein ACIRVF_31730 [Kitasatospora sp. NPDC101157]|uniref:hypothetical protein n=1 Tax=Kitasatospora sp. NPDC101157 TaxID=3364098 RepID=UPI0037F8F82E
MKRAKSIRVRVFGVLALMVMGSGAGVLLAFPAAAAGDSGAKSWGGKCHYWHDRNTGGGWCDGNGPTKRYYAFGLCNDGFSSYGVERWAGDRRGSYVYCAGHGGLSGTWGLAKNW